MKKRNEVSILLPIFLWASLFLAGCGGGGSGTSDVPQAQTGSTITGVASKGLIAGGVVSVYAIDANGQKVTPELATTTTGNDGTYSLSIDSTGPILVEITGGSYLDEATGSTRQIGQPLRAALPSVDGDIQIAITPLTEIAVRMAQAGGSFSSNTIASANNLLSQLLGVDGDIVGTQPANPGSAAAFGQASTESQNYALLLAAISQMSETNGQDVMDIVSAMEADIQDLQLGQTGVDLVAAISDFLDSSENHTGVSDASALTGTIEGMIEDGFTPTGSLAEAKTLLADFLKDPSQSNYDAVTMYLNAFTPESKEAYLFKALAALMNLYQNDAAGFITNGLNLSTDMNTFDADQFVSSLLHSTTIGPDILDLHAEIATTLGNVYTNLQQAEGVNTSISLTGFDTVYMDDVDVKILEAITKALQSIFIYAQSVNYQVDNWTISDGASGTVDVRDLFNSHQGLSNAQEAEFMANNTSLLKYADTTKLPDFRAAFLQAASDMTRVVQALDALGTSGREARRQNAFNIDADLDFYMAKAISEHTMASLVEAMGDSTASIESVHDEEVGGTLILADDGYTYMQTQSNIYLASNTPVAGMITLYDMVTGAKSPRDLEAAANADPEYAPYIEGASSLYQSGITDTDWESPLDSVELNAAAITIDGNASDWDSVPVAKSINGFTIKMAAGAGQEYYVYISNPPMASGDGSTYSLNLGAHWPWWMMPPTDENFYADVYLNNSGTLSLICSEYGEYAPTYVQVPENDKALIFSNGNLVGLEIKFSQLDRLAKDNYTNSFYFSWNLGGGYGYHYDNIKIYP
jgi:hypothetical protein